MREPERRCLDDLMWEMYPERNLDVSEVSMRELCNDPTVTDDCTLALPDSLILPMPKAPLYGESRMVGVCSSRRPARKMLPGATFSMARRGRKD